MRRTRTQCLLACVIFWLTGVPIGAVEPVPEWRFESWRSSDGLPLRGVSVLCRSRDGYLWVGGQDGLHRFNGREFDSFSLPTDAENDQPTVLAIYEDAAETLWIGTDRGLMRWQGEKFELVALDLPSHEVSAITEDRNRRLWLGTSRGVVVVEGKRTTQLAGYDRPVTAIVEDPLGAIWIAGYGLYKFDGKQLRAFKLRAPAAEPSVTSLAVTSDGRLWLATELGLLQFTPGHDDRDGVAVKVVPRDPVQPEIPIRRVEALAGDRIVAGSEDGQLLEQVDGGLIPVSWKTHVHSASIRAIHTDREGGVWIGSQQVLAHAVRSPFVGLGPEQGFPNHAATAVLSDRSGRLWIGTRGAGLVIFDGQVLRPAPHNQRLPAQLVAALAEGRDGSIYVATRPDGLARIDDRGVEDLTHRFKLDRDRIRAIHQARDGTIWLATLERGVVRIVGDRLESRPELAALSDEYVSQITSDAGGAIWVVADRSLVRVDGAQIERYGSDRGFDATYTISITPDGSDWWVGTEGAGMMLFRNGRFVDLRAFAPTMMSDVASIALDRRGYLWLSGHQGLQRIARDQLVQAVDGVRSRVEVRTFGAADGLATSDFSGYSMQGSAIDRSGRIWFTSGHGVIGSLTDSQAQSKRMIPLRIDRVQFAGNAWLGAGPLRIPAQTPQVEFRLTALTFQPEERVRLRYKLEGVDRDWVDAGSESTATYHFLPGGQHQLQVEMLDDSGRWQNASSTLEFEVEKRLTESIWFHPAVIVACGILALAIHRWRSKSLQRRAALLEAQVRERTALLSQAKSQLELRVQQRTAELTRELAHRSQLEEQLVQARLLERIGRLAGGMAHDLNNILTAILGNAELADSRNNDPEVKHHLSQVRSSGERAALLTQRLLGFARQQLVRPERIDVGERLIQMKEPLKELCRHRAELRIDVPAHSVAIRLDPRQFESLIFELVSNARDAFEQPGVIEVHVREVTVDAGEAELEPGPYVEIQVRDEGSGMSDEARQHLFEPFFTTKDVGAGSGLGLASVFGIVKQNRGAVRVESSSDRGTCVRLLIPRSERPVQSASAASAS
jgi:signal transduction histidine kinase/streptogramin lyase